LESLRTFSHDSQLDFWRIATERLAGRDRQRIPLIEAISCCFLRHFCVAPEAPLWERLFGD
jgi:hypothetical protein